MLPVSAFDSDDDRSVSSSGSGEGVPTTGGAVPYSDDESSQGSGNSGQGTPMGTGSMLVPTTPTPPRTTATLNSSQGGNGLGRLNPLARHRDDYNDIYSSSGNHNNNSHFASNMNLKELDAYVQETVRAQRQQRRKETCTKLVLLMAFVVISATMLGSSVFVWGDMSKSQKQKNKQAPPRMRKPIPPFVPPEGYQMSQCEGKLNMGRSFPELIFQTEHMEDFAKCRPEVRI